MTEEAKPVLILGYVIRQRENEKRFAASDVHQEDTLVDIYVYFCFKSDLSLLFRRIIFSRHINEFPIPFSIFRTHFRKFLN